MRVHVLGPGVVFTHCFLFLVMTEHTGNVLVTGTHYSQAWSAAINDDHLRRIVRERVRERGLAAG